MLFLGGVQPITGEMAAAAGAIVEDRPSEGELELYLRKGTRFQTLMVVVSVAGFRMIDGVAQGVPYAISLIPANKRATTVSEVAVEYVRQIDLNSYMQKQEPCYVGFDPFKGEWELFGPIGTFLGPTPVNTFPDELGLVTDMYYLQLGFDPDDVLLHDWEHTNEQARRKYHRHRMRLMFTPFKKVEARRVWGAQSPIELFLLQALLGRGLSPTLQMLFFDDGSSHPSLYNFWDAAAATLPTLITEADLYFPDQKVAVFCDSARHHRGGKAAARDTAISERLAAIGVKAVRVPGPMIVHDLARAADLVCAALA
jgi:hypothetical protein